MTNYRAPRLDDQLLLARLWLSEKLNWSPRVFANRMDSLELLARRSKVAHLQHAHRELRKIQAAA